MIHAMDLSINVGLTETVSSIGAVLGVILVLASLGALVGGSAARIPGADLMVGLGIASAALTIVAGATPLPLSTAMALVGAAAAVGCGALFRRRCVPGGPAFWWALVLIAPLLWIAAAAPATMWDDFFHWLPNAAYAYRFDHLAGAGFPDSAARWPGYPQTMPYLTLAASLLAGRFLECAGPIANLAMLGAFAAALAATLGREGGPPSHHLASTGVVLAFCTLLNPGFDQRVALSTYADVATGIAVALCGVLGCRIVTRLDQSRHHEARVLAWRFAFIAVALVNLKQANPVLLALIGLGLGLVAWRRRTLPAPALLRLTPILLGPSLLVWVIWRAYVAVHFPAGEMTFRPPETWNWSALPSTIGSIWTIQCNNPWFYFTIHGLTVAGIAAAVRRPGGLASQLLVLTAVGWIGYHAFLVVVYLGAMTPIEAGIAADYWRYAPHLGPLATAAVAAGVVSALSRCPPRWFPAASAVAGCVVCAVAIGFAADRYDPRRHAWPMLFRAVGRALADDLPAGARVAVTTGNPMDPIGAGIHYDLWRPGREDRNLRMIWGCENDADNAVRSFRDGISTHLLITGALQDVTGLTRVLGVRPIGSEIVLFAWNRGTWQELRSWPVESP